MGGKWEPHITIGLPLVKNGGAAKLSGSFHEWLNKCSGVYSLGQCTRQPMNSTGNANGLANPHGNKERFGYRPG